MAGMNNRMAFEIEMTPEKVEEVASYIKNARENMQEGMIFRLELSHNVDLVFKGLKNYKSFSSKSIGRETEASPLVDNALRTLN